MRSLSSFALLLAFPPLAFPQAGANALEVTASRQFNLTPDEVTFSLIVIPSVDTKLAQVVAALQPAGLPIDFSGAGDYYADADANRVVVPQWSFTASVPFSQMRSALSSLAALKQNIGHNNSGLTLDYFVMGSGSSPQLLQSQACRNEDLIADAQARAKQLAAAAGLIAGPILAVSDGSLVLTRGFVAGTPPIPAFRAAALPDTVAVSPLVGPYFVLPSSQPHLSCSIVVKFQLLRYQ